VAVDVSGVDAAAIDASIIDSTEGTDAERATDIA